MSDWLGQSVVGANGTAVVIMNHNKNGLFWVVEQVSTQTSKVASSTTTWILLNGSVVAPSAALTPLGSQGQAATAAGLPYVYLAASDSLYINVQGAAVGDTLTVRAQYIEVPATDPMVRYR
jgi:hypothetical protein